MSEPKTKDELVEMIKGARASLEAEVARVGAERMTEEGVMPGWTVKDLLAHISVWERRMVGWVAETLRGNVPQQLPPGMTWDDLDRWNQESFEECRDRPLDQVLTEFAASYEAALKATEEAPEEALMEPNRYPWREGKPMWHMVAANTFWHYQEHRETIGDWLGGTG
jgi:uncharacterized protein (TIGR03083 family)